MLTVSRIPHLLRKRSEAHTSRIAHLLLIRSRNLPDEKASRSQLVDHVVHATVPHATCTRRLTLRQATDVDGSQMEANLLILSQRLPHFPDLNL